MKKKNTFYNNLNFRRILAYMFDVLLVQLIAGLLIETPLNPSYEDYTEDYKIYEETYDNYVKNRNTLLDYYDDKKFTDEELTKLSDIEIFAKTISKVNLEEDKAEDIYNDLETILTEDITKAYNASSYQMSKDSIYANIINVIVVLLYFVVFQFIAKGQTFGKRMLKLQVQSVREKNLNIGNYLLRSLVLNNILISTITIFAITFLNKTAYITVSQVLSTISLVLEFGIIFLVFYRKDKRGLHDLLAGTKVVDLKSSLEENEEKIKLLEIKSTEIEDDTENINQEKNEDNSKKEKEPVVEKEKK